MAIRDATQLAQDIASLIDSAGSPKISAADLRVVLTNIIESLAFATAIRTDAQINTLADARALARYTATEKTKLGNLPDGIAGIVTGLEGLSGDNRLNATIALRLIADALDTELGSTTWRQGGMGGSNDGVINALTLALAGSDLTATAGRSVGADIASAALTLPFLLLTGGTLTGALSGVAPTGAAHLTRKDYVDTADALKASLAGATFTGAVSGITPTADAHLATKAYVDTGATGVQGLFRIRQYRNATSRPTAGSGGTYVQSTGVLTPSADWSRLADLSSPGTGETTFYQEAIINPRVMTTDSVTPSWGAVLEAGTAGVDASALRTRVGHMDSVTIGTATAHLITLTEDVAVGSDYQLEITDDVSGMMVTSPIIPGEAILAKADLASTPTTYLNSLISSILATRFDNAGIFTSNSVSRWNVLKGTNDRTLYIVNVNGSSRANTIEVWRYPRGGAAATDVIDFRPMQPLFLRNSGTRPNLNNLGSYTAQNAASGGYRLWSTVPTGWSVTPTAVDATNTHLWVLPAFQTRTRTGWQTDTAGIELGHVALEDVFAAGGGSAIGASDEGTSLTTMLRSINFTGDGVVAASDASGNLTVAIGAGATPTPPALRGGVSADATPTAAELTIEGSNGTVTFPAITDEFQLIAKRASDGDITSIIFSDDDSRTNQLGAFTKFGSNLTVNSIEYGVWVSNTSQTTTAQVIATVT